LLDTDQNGLLHERNDGRDQGSYTSHDDDRFGQSYACSRRRMYLIVLVHFVVWPNIVVEAMQSWTAGYRMVLTQECSLFGTIQVSQVDGLVLR